MEMAGTKCKHDSCACEPISGGDYCCSACGEASEKHETIEPGPCPCGHEGCTPETLTLAEAEGLMLVSESLA